MMNKKEEEDQSLMIVRKSRGTSKTSVSGAKLSTVHSFGATGPIRNNVVFIDKNKVAYPCGRQLVFLDTSTGEMTCTRSRTTALFVTAMAIDPARSYIALCEGGRSCGKAVISFYSTNTCKVAKVISCQSAGDVLSCCFSNDGKELAVVTSGDSVLAIWKWANSKCLHQIKTMKTITRISVNPRNPKQYIASGSKYLRVWQVDATSTKDTQLIKPTKKEMEGNFADHAWTKKKELAVVNNDKLLIFVSASKDSILQLTATVDLDGASIVTLAAYSKGLCFGGSDGYFSVYERTGDSEEPYSHIKSFVEDERDAIVSLASSPNDEKVACFKNSKTMSMFRLSYVHDLDPSAKAFNDLVCHGIHRSSISSMSVCTKRPIVATCGSDHQIIIWNYIDWTCEIVEESTSEPTCLSLHPSGFLLLVGMKDCAKIFNICDSKFVLMSKITSIKHCEVASFSHGGQYFACDSGMTNVVVYSTFTSQLLHTFVGHIAFIHQIQWSMDDAKVFSVGADGGIYCWRINDGQRVSEAVVKNCHFTDVISNRAGSTFAAVGDDSRLHVLSNNERTSFAIDVVLTSIALPSHNGYCLVGTADGRVRVYPWPLPRVSDVVPKVLGEFSLHSSAIIALRVSPDGAYLISASKDGTVCISALRELEEESERPWKPPSRSFFNAPTVVLLRKDLEEMHARVLQLSNTIDDVKSEGRLELDLLKRSAKKDMQSLRSSYDSKVETLQSKNADLKVQIERAIEEHTTKISNIEAQHRSHRDEMEESYDYKLANEMARYDKLREDMDLLKMHCEQALQQQEELLRDEIDAIKDAHLRKEQLLQDDIRHLREDIDENARKFEEERAQQESEYEHEIESLKTLNRQAVEKEWKEQAKKEGEIMEHKSKMKKKAKKIVELRERNDMEAARNKTLQKKNQELERLLEHRHHSIQEMKDSLHDKEKEILTLRANNRKLNHFRYVLDSKIQDLTRERAPAAEHITKLEEHIKDMYDELVKDFSEKKANARLLDKKELHIESLTREVQGMRKKSRDREQIISSFLSALDRSVKISDPKEAQGALKSMYRTFAKKDDRDFVTAGAKTSSATTDDATLREALRQRSHMMKTCATLKRALKISEEKMRSQMKRSMAQNALLINECNALRKENKMNKILMHEVQERNKLLERQSALDSSKSRRSPRKLKSSNGDRAKSKSPKRTPRLTPFLSRKEKEMETSFARVQGLNASPHDKKSLLRHDKQRSGNRNTSIRTYVTKLERKLQEDAKTAELQRLEISRLKCQVDMLLSQASGEGYAK